MNIYYKVNLKIADDNESLLYILLIERHQYSIEGKVLKIISLCDADRYDVAINITTNFIDRCCTLIEDQKLINELDKLMVFQ